MTAEWMDETDCVGSWQNERLAAVMFPTADTLTQVRQLARVKGPHRLMLVINPQWQTDGQVVSDFGCASCYSLTYLFLCSFACLFVQSANHPSIHPFQLFTWSSRLHGLSG